MENATADAFPSAHRVELREMRRGTLDGRLNVTRSQSSLRELLETLAELEFVHGELSAEEARQLAATFRICRLEYVKQARNPLTTSQSHRLQQLDYRLQIVAEGQGSAAAIRDEAMQTLDAFRWSLEY